MLRMKNLITHLLMCCCIMTLGSNLPLTGTIPVVQASTTASASSKGQALKNMLSGTSKSSSDSTEASTATTEEDISVMVTIQGTLRQYSNCKGVVYINNKEIDMGKHPVIRHDNANLGSLDVIFKNTLKLNCEATKYGITLRYNSNVLTLKKGEQNAMLNGESYVLDTAPVLGQYKGDQGSIWLVPLKSVCAALGISYTVYDNKLYIGQIPKKATDGEEDEDSVSSKTQASALKFMSHREFINFIGEIAQQDYKRSGILPSVTIAQAIVESGWGKSGLTQKGNNLFGIKAGSGRNNWKDSTWDGSSVIHIGTHEEEAGQIISIMADFRAYASVEDSIMDHSAYLANSHNGIRKRYSGITRSSNYNEVIDIIVNGGYCTGSTYANQLKDVIRTYRLYQWDR